MNQFNNILKPKTEQEIFDDLSEMTPAKRLLYKLKFELDRDEQIFIGKTPLEIKSYIYKKISEINSENVIFIVEQMPDIKITTVYIKENESRFNPSAGITYTLDIYHSFYE